MFLYYILDDILDDDTTDNDNGIIDKNDAENYDHDNSKNNDGNNHNDNNDDDNDGNYDNDNGDLTIMIFQAIHFGETYICQTSEFSAHTHICMHKFVCTHVFIVWNPFLLIEGAVIFQKS